MRSLRIDLRGTGDSEGLPDDEYTPAEQADLIAAIAWIAEQTWCSGKVGMMGISWGGFNSLQVAMHRPPALKAIITVCASDDRYNDDVHYMQGCLLHDNFAWSSAMYAFVSQPPDPAIVGERWRDMWIERLKHYKYPARIWYGHQRRDEYWRQGSACENYDAIECAVFAVGGWEDGYSNAVARLVEKLKAPCIGLAGPWGHAYPHNALPGPAIGFLQEALRFWDHWLKGRDTGLMAEPKLRVWMNRSHAPDPCAAERPGRWIAHRDWPAPAIEIRDFWLGARGLEPTRQPDATLSIKSPQNDRHDDRRMVLLRRQRRRLSGRPAHRRRQLAVLRHACRWARRSPSSGRRACILLLGRPAGGQDLRAPQRRRAGRRLDPHHLHAVRAQPRLGPGQSHRAGAGQDLSRDHPAQHHRVSGLCGASAAGRDLDRVLAAAVAGAICARRVTVHTGDSRLELPVRPPHAEDTGLRPFDPPAKSAMEPCTVTREADWHRTITRDVATGATELVMVKDSGGMRYDDIDWRLDCAGTERYRIRPDDPLSAEADCVYHHELSRGDWVARSVTRTTLKGDATHFHFTATVDAYFNGERIFSDQDVFSIPRDFM